jgi:hypothetical protein
MPLQRMASGWLMQQSTQSCWLSCAHARPDNTRAPAVARSTRAATIVQLFLFVLRSAARKPRLNYWRSQPDSKRRAERPPPFLVNSILRSMLGGEDGAYSPKSGSSQNRKRSPAVGLIVLLKRKPLASPLLTFEYMKPA